MANRCRSRIDYESRIYDLQRENRKLKEEFDNLFNYYSSCTDRLEGICKYLYKMLNSGSISLESSAKFLLNRFFNSEKNVEENCKDS